MLDKVKESLKTENVIIAILVLLIIIITSIYIVKKNSDKVTFEKQDNGFLAKATTSPAIVATAKALDEIKVYVTGAVKSPGIVSIKKGQLIEDAVKLAGGYTNDADTENINRVYQLSENVMLKIKSKNATYNISQESKGVNGGKSVEQPIGVRGGEVKKGYEIIKDSTGAIERAGDNQDTSTNSIININTASRLQINSLPGVGDSTADKIVQYREKNGAFKTKEELKNVSGIGDAKFNTLKDKISVN